MVLELFMISISVTLLVLSAILVALFTNIGKSLAAIAEMLREIRQNILPVMDDVRIIRRQAVALSESLRSGMDGVSRMGEAIGNIGDDLEGGRKAVKGGVRLLERLIGPWLSKMLG